LDPIAFHSEFCPAVGSPGGSANYVSNYVSIYV